MGITKVILFVRNRDWNRTISLLPALLIQLVRKRGINIKGFLHTRPHQCFMNNISFYLYNSSMRSILSFLPMCIPKFRNCEYLHQIYSAKIWQRQSSNVGFLTTRSRFLLYFLMPFLPTNWKLQPLLHKIQGQSIGKFHSFKNKIGDTDVQKS